MKKRISMLLMTALSCVMLAGCNTGVSVSEPVAEAAIPDTAAQDYVMEEAEPGTEDEEAPGESQDQEAAMAAQQQALTPIPGDQIRDGVYAIEVSSSSSMFRIVDAQLTVQSGDMTALITLSGTGYEKLYMGTGEAALADPEDNAIYFVENDEGGYAYEVPVAALDQETDVAAWSIKKKKWYDRVLIFQSSLIPEDAIAAM